MKNAIRCLALAVSFVGASCFAQGKAGIHAGVGIPTGDGVKMGVGFGGSVEFNVSPEVTLGGFFTYQMLGNEASTDEVSLSASQLPFGLLVNYYIENFYIGANLGMTRTAVEASALGVSITASTTDLSVGAQLGFDAPVADNMTAGVEARYIHIMSDGSTAGLMNISGTLKFAF